MERQATGESLHPRLFGLVLAGGNSSRMGSEKGAIVYHGIPHARFLYGLLMQICERTFVSVNPRQQAIEPYASLPVIVDLPPYQGPASGVLAAARTWPDVAWLVVAVDLAALTGETLSALVRARRPSAAATVFRHPDGVLEPLCAIWEPAGCALLAERVTTGDASPRRCLESAQIEVLECPNPASLRSYDSSASAAELRGGD